jgi:predicted DCC family thiol-disulfide oxidoreductase YuxK
MDAAAKLTVYDDGSCPFCQWAQAWVERRDPEHRLEFRDFNRPEVAAETPFAPAELGRRMYVRAPDGDWHIGFFGWIAVLSALPHWRWLAGLMRVPPCRWAGPRVYQFIADHRYQIPRFLLRWMGAPPPCDVNCALPRRDERSQIRP